MKNWMKLIVLAIAGVMLLAACGGETASPTTGRGGAAATAPAASGQEITVGVAGETLKFDKEALTAKAGEPIKFTFKNSSTTLPHSFIVEKANVSIPADSAAAAAGLPTGQSGTAEGTLAAGTYTFYCGVPGHKEGGMTGTLTVQ